MIATHPPPPGRADARGMRLVSLLAIAAFGLVLLVSALWSAFTYAKLRAVALDELDDKLLVAADLARTSLPRDYHDRITGVDSVSKDAYLAIVLEYDRLCLAHDMEYVWSLIEIGGTLRFTSGTSQHKKEHTNHAGFFEEHSNPGAYAEALRTMKVQHTLITDKWGKLRSVLVPEVDSHGRKVIFGASMRLDEVNAILDRHLTTSIGVALLLSLLGGSLGVLFARRISRPAAVLAAGVQAVADGQFGRAVPARGSREMRILAESFNRMNRALAENVVALRESEERKKLALHGAGLGTWDWHVPTGKIAFNDRWTEMLGYEPEEIEPHVNAWKDLVYPDDWLSVQETLNAHLDKKTALYETEHRLRHKSGRWVWVLDKGRVIERDADGKAVRVCGTHLDITERKLAEQARIENESRFREIFENISSGVAIYEAIDHGEDFIFKDINPAGVRIGRTKREDHLGRRVTEIYPGVKKMGLFVVLQEVWHTGVPQHFPVSRYEDKRVMLWMENYVCKLPSGSVVAVYEDMTARKQAELALEKRLVALTQPLEAADGITFETLFNLGDIQRLQDEFARATGVASIITATDGTPNTKPSNFCRLCNDVIRGTEKGRVNCYKSDAVIGRHNPDGPIVQHCLSGGLWDAGAAIAVGGRHIANWLIGQVRDETQTEERMRAYAREIGTDEEIFIKAFHEVPVMSHEQLDGVAQVLFTLANQLSNSAYQNVQQARFITDRQRAEEAARRANELLVEQQRTENERIERELAKAQRKLITQTRLATIGQVAGSIAHELRNPLGAIRNAAFFLGRYLAQENSTTFKHLRIIEEEVTAADRIITNLMGVIRSERPAKRPVALDALIEEVLTRVELPSSIQWEVAIAPPSLHVVADGVQLRQVLVNLITNAVQAMNRSGRLRISAWQDGACDEIRVEDNGPGVQAESPEQVFEPLFTTKAKGTGLGLTICRETIERHGGTLDVADTELGGAAFRIRLPRETASSSEPRSRQSGLSDVGAYAPADAAETEKGGC